MLDDRSDDEYVSFVEDRRRTYKFIVAMFAPLLGGLMLFIVGLTDQGYTRMAVGLCLLLVTPFIGWMAWRAYFRA